MQYSTEFKEMGTDFRLPSQTDRTVLPRWVNQISVITAPNSRKVMYYLTSSGHESAWVNFHSFFFPFSHSQHAGRECKGCDNYACLQCSSTQEMLRALCHTSPKVQVT